MFAVLSFDRDPLKFEDVFPGFLLWVQVAGGFAAFGLLLWYLVGLPRWRKEDHDSVPSFQKGLFLLASVVCLGGYLLAGLMAVRGGASSVAVATGAASARMDLTDLFTTIAGAAALVAVGMPFVINLFSLRFRRILALAQLSFKEAIRRRVLYAFSGALLVFLFASWFVPVKPSDQVRTYVEVVYTTMSLLLLFTAMLLTSFSIPNDIKQQTIHTIVTKPVERFEVVLGRYFGFLALMTLVLLIMTGVSLLYILRGIHPEAAAESLKARVPHYGDLRFENTDNERTATNVGREWEYRSYISKPSPGQQAQTARWDFFEIPASLGQGEQVRFEYSFDIYRTTKGDEGRGVAATFRFTTWRYQKGDDQSFRKERDEREKTEGRSLKLDNELAEKYGYWEINSLKVEDYTTQSFFVPAGFFRNALGGDQARRDEVRAQSKTKIPLVEVRVVCDSPTQFIGMARYDLYARLDRSGTNEQLLFSINLFKGAFGLWLQLALVIGLAVVLSTYLNGVITFLVTLLLFVGGGSREFIESVAVGKNFGGGPTEALTRIIRREISGASFSDSASITDQLFSRSDDAFRWLIRRIIHIVPDVELYNFTPYVAEGFDIPLGQMGLDLLILFAYLLPWGVLAFYLIRWREVASST